jgi:predicted transcriptional regulator
VARVFGGEPVSMLLHLVGETKLSKADIKKLKDMLNEKEK